jgi:hypothetical protein
MPPPIAATMAPRPANSSEIEDIAAYGARLRAVMRPEIEMNRA